MARADHPRGLSAAAKKELWERWRAGQSISDIARALQKPAGSIHGMIEATGGISAPQRRRPTMRAHPGRAGGDLPGAGCRRVSARDLARRLGRCASTVCREVNRNGGRSRYRVTKADQKAWQRARRPKRCLLAIDEHLGDVVAGRLREDCSPEQISGWLKKEYREDEVMRVSHETIYRTLFVQARGALKRELLAHLRSRSVDAPVPTRVDEGTTARADQGGHFHPRASARG